MNDSTGLANKLELNDYYGDYGVREISIFNRKKKYGNCQYHHRYNLKAVVDHATVGFIFLTLHVNPLNKTETSVFNSTSWSYKFFLSQCVS